MLVIFSNIYLPSFLVIHLRNSYFDVSALQTGEITNLTENKASMRPGRPTGSKSS